MTSNERLVIGAIFILLAIGVGAILAQHSLITSLTNENVILTSQIKTLQVESIAQTERFEKARIKASDEVKQSQEQVKQIMLANIPKRCALAIKWGIQQAQGFTA